MAGNGKYNIIKQALVFLSDAVLVCAALLISYALRFNTLDLDPYAYQLAIALPVMAVARLGVFLVMGMYRGMWRFVGMRDLVALVEAVTLSSALSVGLLCLTTRLEGFPRSVFVIDWFVCLVLVGGSRFVYRIFREGLHRNGHGRLRPGKRVLIVGAGRAGEMILREILNNAELEYDLVGFVDDDRKKRNMAIHGCRVLGPSGGPASADYAVEANGKPVFVYRADVLHGGPASFASFDFSGTVQVAVTSQRPVRSAKIRPMAAGIAPTVQNNTIRFELSRPGQLTVELDDGIERPLHLFANAWLTGRPESLRGCTMELAAVGASTGWDMLTGFLPGMCVTFP